MQGENTVLEMADPVEVIGNAIATEAKFYARVAGPDEKKVAMALHDALRDPERVRAFLKMDGDQAKGGAV